MNTIARQAVPVPRAFSRAATAVATLLVLVAASAASLIVALANQPYFDLVNGALRLQDPVGRGAVFSSYLLLLGGAVVTWRPRAFGLQIGASLAHWQTIVVVVGGLVAVTTVALLLTGPTPYSDAAAINEIVIVPFTEELVFRGVALTALLAVLGRFHAPQRTLVLAVVINAVAFGAAHGANLSSFSPSFVLPQIAFATVVGGAAAYLMAATRSVYPAMVAHAAVNAVVVAL